LVGRAGNIDQVESAAIVDLGEARDLIVGGGERIDFE
jgi:hypothetical protein